MKQEKCFAMLVLFMCFTYWFDDAIFLFEVYLNGTKLMIETLANYITNWLKLLNTNTQYMNAV